MRILDEGPRDAFRLPARRVRRTAGAEATAAHAHVRPREDVRGNNGRAARYEIALTEIRLNRLAQLPDRVAAQGLRREHARARSAGAHAAVRDGGRPAPGPGSDGALLHLTGELLQLLGPPVRRLVEPRARRQEPRADDPHRASSRSIGGDDLDGTITLTGPFIASPAVGLDLKNLDFDVPLRANEEPLRLTLAEVHGKIDLVNEQGYIDKTKALIRGGKEPGEVELSATFGLKPLNCNAQVEIVKAIDVGRFLPRAVAASVGKFLQGRLRANGDIEEGFALERLRSRARRDAEGDARSASTRAGCSRDNDFDTIQIEKVASRPAAATRCSTAVEPAAPRRRPRREDHRRVPRPRRVAQAVRRPAVDHERGGGGEIVITGKLTNPTVTVSEHELGGVPCLDKLRIDSATIADNRVDVREIRSTGPRRRAHRQTVRSDLGGAIKP